MTNVRLLAQMQTRVIMKVQKGSKKGNKRNKKGKDRA